MIRVIKILMLASIAFFFSLVAYGNMVDPQANWQFVTHVLSMDTTFHDSVLMNHAITNLHVEKIAYETIIFWESVTAVVCWLGVVMLLRKLSHPFTVFNAAKKIGVLGLFMGFLLYVVGFIDIGGEWFAMWQSPVWNGQMKAGLFSMIILFVLLFLTQAEE